MKINYVNKVIVSFCFEIDSSGGFNLLKVSWHVNDKLQHYWVIIVLEKNCISLQIKQQSLTICLWIVYYRYTIRSFSFNSVVQIQFSCCLLPHKSRRVIQVYFISKVSNAKGQTKGAVSKGIMGTHESLTKLLLKDKFLNWLKSMLVRLHCYL